MFRNNLKMMLRNMRRHSMQSVINIAGLAVGLSCFMVIALYVRHELSFDTMFSRSSSIYRVTMSSVVGGQANFIPTSYPTIAGEISDQFPSIEGTTRLYNFKYSRLEPTFAVGDKVYYENKVLFADSTFFDLFDFPFVQGDRKTALDHPNSVVITERIAKKYFGGEPALGKYLKFNNRGDVQVSGVVKEISSTHIQFDFLIPFSNLVASGSKIFDNWSIDWFWTYMIIPNPADVMTIEKGINALAAERLGEVHKENDVTFFLQPLTDVHLYSTFDYNTDLVHNGSINNLYIFISVGVLVLLISAINFVNISMAMASRRFKEIGISKVLGALRSQLRNQFLSESVMVCIFALLLALVITQLSLPWFNSLLNVPLSIAFPGDLVLIAAMAAFTILTGLAAGLFPALYVSSFEPYRVLKGLWKSGQGGTGFRKVLVGVQIGISIFLIIGTVVIFEQLRYIQNKELGFDKDQVVLIPVRDTKVVKGFYSFKNELLSESSINNVSSVSEPIGREVQFMVFAVEGHEKSQFIKILNVTHDFVGTMGLEIVKGRDFSKEIVTDSTAGFIINEAAAKSFGWTDPIGKSLDHDFRKNKQGTVIGVVKDFNFEPLQKQIDPIVIWYGGPYWFVAVNVQKDKTASALAAMEREWKRIEPNKPFTFQFLDQAIQHVYENEQRVGNVFVVFSILSILTAIIGLYGLISFIAQQRLSEIGIRKVMGASVRSILYLLSKEWLTLIAVSFVVTAPVTWWIVNKWLQGFAFRIDWNVIYFVIGLVATTVIVISTVWARAIRAANVNPIDVLRSE
jgi:putative ABC transport system permease protein